MVKPWQTLLFLVGVGFLCGLFMWVFPSSGMPLSGDVVLRFPSWDDFLAQDSTENVIVDQIIAEEPIVDSVAIKDSILRYQQIQRAKRIAIQLPEGKHPLNHFARALQQTKTRQVRILHYGDSQIEGDRITSVLRQNYQTQYGGRGAGMLPIAVFVPHYSVAQDDSGNWLRYTKYGKQDTSIKHNAFGYRAIFNRFCPVVKDSTYPDTVKAWASFKPSRWAFSKTKGWNKVRLLYGNSQFPVSLKVEVDGQIIEERTLSEVVGSTEAVFSFSSTPNELKFHFEGVQSPDFYGVSFETETGIIIDNIGQRGASGVVFRKLNQGQLQTQYGSQNVDLVILQYGGNTVPYIDSKKKAENYGKYFASQIRYLKRLLPNASFLLIGPSDMSTKINGKLTTYPFLPAVRDVLKTAALENGVAYWDLYEVMGGRNSMPAWVNANPPLAGPDYIHFTPDGSRKVGGMLYEALQKELKKMTQKEPAPNE